MLPMLYYFLTIVASFSIIIFVLYYTFRFHAKEKELDARLKKADTEYHKIVDDALSKERKILDDATSEADKIISDTSFVTNASKESLDKALGKMVTEFEKESNDTGRAIMGSYQESLKEVTAASLKNFGTISKELEADLQKQIAAFNQTQLANMEKSLEEYKKAQLHESQEVITKIIKQVSQDVLNKAISLDDHQKLIIDSFEKAKREGIFD